MRKMYQTLRHPFVIMRAHLSVFCNFCVSMKNVWDGYQRRLRRGDSHGGALLMSAEEEQARLENIVYDLEQENKRLLAQLEAKFKKE